MPVGQTRYEFFQWAGDATGTSTTTTVVMNGPKTATARYRAFADLAITLTGGPNPVTVGDQMYYRILVTNHGPSLETNATVTLVLPTQVSNPVVGLCTGAAPVVCKIDYLPSGSVGEFDFLVVAAQIGVGTATASVSSAVTTDLDLTNNTATLQTTINPTPTVA